MACPRGLIRGSIARLQCALLLLGVCCAGAVPVRGGDIETLEGCTWVGAEWADGDSFPIRTADGRELTLRLYGVDCLEWHVRDEGDARRLRAQRRHFGVAGGGAEASIAQAREFGAQAARRVRELLARPFTVHTAYADGRGDSRYRRVYAFVTTAEGRDLGAQLVQEGLARAFGVSRSTPDGRSSESYREHLRDLELAAAGARRGIWASTDWSSLPQERQAEREEEAELALATARPKPPAGAIDPNTASRDDLMSLPGVGEVLAVRILEARGRKPFASVEDLGRVPGIGPALLEKIRPHVVVKP